MGRKATVTPKRITLARCFITLEEVFHMEWQARIIMAGTDESVKTRLIAVTRGISGIHDNRGDGEAFKKVKI